MFLNFFEDYRLLNYSILSIINSFIGQLNTQAFFYKKSSISTLSDDSLLRACLIKSPAAEKKLLRRDRCCWYTQIFSGIREKR